MNIQELVTSFSKKDFSSNIIFESKDVLFKSLDNQFKVILMSEFSDAIRKYKKEIRNCRK